MYNLEQYKDRFFTSNRNYKSTSSYKEKTLYMESVYDVVLNMVIKSTEAGDMSHQFLLDNVPDYDPDIPESEWIYYKHISGEHIPGYDEPMIITSIDDLTSMEITKNNLVNHPSTKEALIHDKEYFNSILKKHPDKELLLRGMLTDVDKQEAIDAKDGQILYWPSHLVEEGEIRLRLLLQDWIFKFKHRWNNPSFMHTDDYYPLAHTSILSMALVPAILNIRFTLANQYDAHTFHIRQHLSSIGLIDRYIEYLSPSQTLFLYNNLRYLKKYAGHESTFRFIVTNLLGDANIPIDGFNIRLTHRENEGWYDPTFYREPIDGTVRSLGVSELTLPQYRVKEIDVLSKNIDSEYDLEVDIIEAHRHSTEVTKLIESYTVDYTNSESLTKYETSFNHWGMAALSDRYTGYVQLNRTATEKLVLLSTKDAFVYWMLLNYHARGIKMTVIPDTVTIPSVQVLESVDPSDWVSDTVTVDDFDYINQRLVPLQSHRTVRTFKKEAELIFKYHNELYNYAHFQENPRRRLDLIRIIDTCYKYVRTEVPEAGKPVEEWLDDRGLTNLPDVDRSTVIMNEMVKGFTGLDPEKEISLKNVQLAVIGALEQLSSYSLSITKVINDKPLSMMAYQQTRIIGVMEGPPNNHIVNTLNPERIQTYYPSNAGYVELNNRWEDLTQAEIDSIGAKYIIEVE